MYETYYQNIKEGDIFIAIKGNHVDGHDFINEAFKMGASKVIGEKKLKIKNYKRVNSTQKYLTKILGKQNKLLTKDMILIGITGTKGKTTTSYMVYNMLKLSNIKAAYIGTLGVYYNDKHIDINNTTPDIMMLNKIFRILKNNEITHVVMEVSSHALCQKRINGLKFKVGGFTNLSQDHLDYHLTMQNYLNSKLKILKYLKGPIILNNDDNASYYFKKRTKNYYTIGTSGDIKINNYNLHPTSTLIYFENNYDHYTVSIPFVGKYNIYNYLMALKIMCILKFDIKDLINLTNSLSHVKGRNELIKKEQKYVIIDYAHSPASVEETLVTYNELKKGKIITIIGCGGNRDKLKRPIMGKLASELSDYVIYTSDNPRDENPKEILNQMTDNLTKKNYTIIENREQAIKKGVKLLKKNDYLLILGKGHENYQIRNNIKYHFDDKEIASKYLF